jgi:hypothetical protein
MTITMIAITMPAIAPPPRPPELLPTIGWSIDKTMNHLTSSKTLRRKMLWLSNRSSNSNTTTALLKEEYDRWQMYGLEAI